MTSHLLPGAALAGVLGSIQPLASKDATLPALTHVRLQLDDAGMLLASATDRYVMGFCRRDIGSDDGTEMFDLLVPAALAKQVATLARKPRFVWLDVDGDRLAFRDGVSGAVIGGQSGEAWREKWPNLGPLLDGALDASAARTLPLSFDVAKLAQFGPASKIAKADPVFWCGTKGAVGGLVSVRIGDDFAGGIMSMKIPDLADGDTARTYRDGFSL